MFVFFEVCDLNIAQGAGFRKIRGQELAPGFAIRAAAVVFPRCQFVSNHAVTYDHAEMPWYREQRILDGTAVEHKCVSGADKARK
jgi:hypothetical protein